MDVEGVLKSLYSSSDKEEFGSRIEYHRNQNQRNGYVFKY